MSQKKCYVIPGSTPFLSAPTDLPPSPVPCHVPLSHFTLYALGPVSSLAQCTKLLLASLPSNKPFLLPKMSFLLSTLLGYPLLSPLLKVNCTGIYFSEQTLSLSLQIRSEALLPHTFVTNVINNYLLIILNVDLPLQTLRKQDKIMSFHYLPRPVPGLYLAFDKYY